MNGKGKTALLLAGAGSRGIIQCGMILAISDLGIDYDLACSSSVGTLNSLKLHAGKLDELTDLWMNIQTKDVYTSSPFSLVSAFSSKGSVHNSSPLRRLIEKSVDEAALRANTRDLLINATNLSTATPLTLSIKDLKNKQEIVDFALASASPPVYFPPVQFRGQTLVDSGVSNNYGIISALQENCDTLILLVATKNQARQVKNILDMVGYIISISTYNYLEREVRAVRKINNLIDLVNESVEPDYRKVNLITILTEKDFGFDFLDFNYKGIDRKMLMQHGYDVAMKTLSKEL